jgi:hypothetical protein
MLFRFRFMSSAAVVVLAALTANCAHDATAPAAAIAPSKANFLINPSGTVVVSPFNMHGWTFVNDQNDAACTDATVCRLVAGPGTPPAGVRSAELATPLSTDGKALILADYAGTRLDAFTTLSYSTYRQSVDAGNNLAIALQFNVDYDLNDAATGFMGRIVFEPYQTNGGSVVQNAWRTWDALSGKWWGSRTTVTSANATVANPCVQATPCTLAQLIAAFPNIGVHATLGAVVLKAGSTWPGFRGNVDNLTIGVNGVNTTFDFEPSSCATTISGTTMTLSADCQTDHTIFIPNGFTLNGGGHTITAVDPAGGHFLGAVVMNGGAVATVTNVRITSSGLADVCDAGTDRLRGILFEGAAGSITNNTVRGVRQGLSGCQEGNAIEVRNEPFDNTGSDLKVTISGNTVSNYQKNGITANGSIAATIAGNVVTGDGPITYIAQNGIQVGFGATATVKNNTVSGNNYSPVSDVACGILLYQADGVKSSGNSLFANERDNCNFGKGGGTFNPNP